MRILNQPLIYYVILQCADPYIKVFKSHKLEHVTLGALLIMSLTRRVQDDLVKPTTNLADMMYKSVEIRDSRHSLQLNTSMWRLSYVPFLIVTISCSALFNEL